MRTTRRCAHAAADGGTALLATSSEYDARYGVTAPTSCEDDPPPTFPSKSSRDPDADCRERDPLRRRKRNTSAPSAAIPRTAPIVPPTMAPTGARWDPDSDVVLAAGAPVFAGEGEGDGVEVVSTSAVYTT